MNNAEQPGMKIDRKKFDFVNFVFKITSGNNEGAPGDWLRFEFGPPDPPHKHMYIANTSNDGYELYIGFYSKWLISLRRDEFFKLARFIIWDYWVIATWCGLKRKIWYWALEKRVSRFSQPRRK